MNSKKKGNRGENQLVHILCSRFGEGKFKRTPSSGAYVGGINKDLNKNLPFEAKITLVSDIITPKSFRFVIEHKFYNSIDFWDIFNENGKWVEWLSQVHNDAKFVEKLPMLIIKYNRHNRIVILDSDFLFNEMKRLNFDVYIRFIWRSKSLNSNFAVLYLDELLEAPDNFWFEMEV